ncbi:hypothetical protein L3V86_00735 [Thiotrichales bacterium 19S11-10]|nr:hypothetical protein [Thiotrichales bacterium 19S11-10]
METEIETYSRIKDQISNSYKLNYEEKRTSRALADDIKDISVEEIIRLLQALKKNENLREESILLSRKSPLFDKLILMKGGLEENPWVLRLHTYNVMDHTDGKIRSNLGDEVSDSEINPHYHRWDLTSRFLQGGFNNIKYMVSDNGNEENKFFEFKLGSTAGDQAKTNNKRKAECLGSKYLTIKSDDVYKQGDLVHYSILESHKVSPQMAPFFGMTMTLAHTSESLDGSSRFYQKVYTEEVKAIPYTLEEHLYSITQAIVQLKLVQLCKIFSESIGGRFVFPNSLETELLPTIAMIQLQKENFTETPMFNCKAKFNNGVSSKIYNLIIQVLDDMELEEKEVLVDLIKKSQENLSKQKFFLKDKADLPDALSTMVDRRNKDIPNDVVTPFYGEGESPSSQMLELGY